MDIIYNINVALDKPSLTHALKTRSGFRDWCKYKAEQAAKQLCNVDRKLTLMEIQISEIEGNIKYTHNVLIKVAIGPKV